jgi:hypothetical protein
MLDIVAVFASIRPNSLMFRLLRRVAACYFWVGISPGAPKITPPWLNNFAPLVLRSRDRGENVTLFGAECDTPPIIPVALHSLYLERNIDGPG